jgi:hypothetical protein
VTALFALATSLLWGLASFGGSLLTRRIPALAAVVPQAIATGGLPVTFGRTPMARL